jgi:hypothetical protein
LAGSRSAAPQTSVPGRRRGTILGLPDKESLWGLARSAEPLGRIPCLDRRLDCDPLVGSAAQVEELALGGKSGYSLPLLWFAVSLIGRPSPGPSARCQPATCGVVVETANICAATGGHQSSSTVNLASSTGFRSQRSVKWDMSPPGG